MSGAKDMEKSMNKLMSKYYPTGAPIIIQVAFKYGFGPAIIELNKKVYFNQSLTFPALFREAIQGLCLSHCENQYCTIMHARGLISEGFTFDEVKHLVAFHRLPDWVPNRRIWEPSLSRISDLFQEPQLASTLYASLSQYLTTNQIEDVGGVIAFSLLHKFLLERYSNEIDISQEPILSQTVDCEFELIKFFTKQDGKLETTYTICCICKAVKGDSCWIPIEQALHELSPKSQFSHGFCESCAEQWRYEVRS